MAVRHGTAQRGRIIGVRFEPPMMVVRTLRWYQLGFAGSLVAMERMGRVRAPERFIGRRTSISASAALEEARP